MLGYFSGWTKQLTLKSCAQGADGIVPLTVFTASENIATCAWIESRVDSYLAEDNVFDVRFLETIFLQGQTSVEDGLHNCVSKAYGTSAILALAKTSETTVVVPNSVVPNGLYVAHISGLNMTLGPVYLIYHDSLQAFMSGIIEGGEEGAFRYVPINTISDASVGVPVPSRLYSANTKTADKPFQGLRVTVKDITDIRGIKTSNGNLLGLKSYSGFPTKLLVPSNLWPVSNNASQPVFAAWIEKLATFLNATIDTTSINTYWNTTSNKTDTEFFSYMQQVAFNLNWLNQIEKVIDPFKSDYAAAKDGRQPFINPFPATRFASAANVTADDVTESYNRFVYFRDWFGSNVVQPDVATCSKSLFLIPMFDGDVSYRNTVYSWPNVSSWSSFLMYYYSVQSQGLEVDFPIGEISYMSNITNVEENLPASIDILAHRGCDFMLLDLAKSLADAGLLKEVKTGRTLF
ncbi:hypothetical protein BX600DRAFT_509512 [Xylariales sp. PMI_506]|nr:hypothetical protein BX600DRAFT_509512 [Xylariales sp. PMI_506]